MRDAALQRAINAAGGVKNLADMLFITKQAVSNWDRCPPERAIMIEKFTGVPKEDLRPDLYPKFRKRGNGRS